VKILALDLATKTGWAWSDGTLYESGVQDFSVKSRESKGMLYVRFVGWLLGLLKALPVDVVAYEQPHMRGAGTTIAVGLETRIHEIHATAAANGLTEFEYVAAHGGSVKKAVLGSANPGHVKAGAPKGVRRSANKKASMEWFQQKTGREPADDNEADAMMLLEWAQREFEGTGLKAGVQVNVLSCRPTEGEAL